MSVRISLLLVLTVAMAAWAAPAGMLDGVDISHYQVLLFCIHIVVIQNQSVNLITWGM
jgi:hypothetical protein